MLLPGTYIGLPDYARLDLAYTQDFVLQRIATGPTEFFWRGRTVPGSFIEVPITVYFIQTNDATVGARTLIFKAQREAGIDLWQLISPLTIDANQTGTFFWGVDVNAVNVTGFSAWHPLPPFAMLPGFSYGLIRSGTLGPADSPQAAIVTVLRIPTGPASDAIAPAPMPLSLVA